MRRASSCVMSGTGASALHSTRKEPACAMVRSASLLVPLVAVETAPITVLDADHAPNLLPPVRPPLPGFV